ncbi:hypothetical protein AFEL58S_02074 [Afipia felis]
MSGVYHDALTRLNCWHHAIALSFNDDDALGCGAQFLTDKRARKVPAFRFYRICMVSHMADASPVHISAAAHSGSNVYFLNALRSGVIVKVPGASAIVVCIHNFVPATGQKPFLTGPKSAGQFAELSRALDSPLFDTENSLLFHADSFGQLRLTDANLAAA